MMASRVGAIVVLLSILAMALGRPQPAGAATSRGSTPKGVVPACALLRLTDVSSIYGSGARPALHRTVGLFDSCDYATRQGVLTFLVTTTARLQQRRARERTAAALFAQVRGTMPGKARSVTHLGDRALWSSPLHQLWVLKGQTLFSLSQFSPGKATLTAIERVARKVLARV